MTSFLNTVASYANPVGYFRSGASSSSSSSSTEPEKPGLDPKYIDTSGLSRFPTALKCYTKKIARVTKKRYKDVKSIFSSPKQLLIADLPGTKPPQSPNLYPDYNATYFVAKIKMKQGQKLVLKGQYAHARYQSYTIANQLGDGRIGNGTFLNGRQIEPDKDSQNPYRAGTPRDTPNRNYTLYVVHGPRPENPEENTLYTDSDEDELRIHFSSRTYLGDKNYDGTGLVMLDEEGNGLPDVTLVDSDGKTYEGEEMFAKLKPQKDGDPNGYDLDQWEKLVATSGDPLNAPCRSTPEAELYWDNPYSVTGTFEGPEEAVKNYPPTNQGGFASNPNTKYINITYSLNLPSDPRNAPGSSQEKKCESSSEVGEKPKKSGFGDVIVIRAKMPTHPKTHEGGNSLPLDPMVQYFSATTYGAPPSGQGYDGKCDEQMPLNEEGWYTVIVGTGWKRPDNTEVENGVTYLDMGHGEGLYSGARPGVGTVMLRFQDCSKTWEESPENVPPPTEEEPIPQTSRIMGDYFPTSCYMSMEECEEYDWNKMTQDQWNEILRQKKLGA